MTGYLKTKKREECYGCGACAQICSKSAIVMCEDEEGFRYPYIDKNKCSECKACNRVCPYENNLFYGEENIYAFGGYSKNSQIRYESTSGGAFSEIADVYCDKNYVIFGAEASGIDVFHNFITDKKKMKIFRKSKYSQSDIGNSYKRVYEFLKENKKILFSGTPCQIAGLKSFLGNVDQENLLTVEVICEGVPSPLYVRKYEKFIEKKYNSKIELLDYRYTGTSFFKNGKWDFEIMKTKLADSKKEIKIDRWFNPFWTIWLRHLMSRPSCYKCPYAQQKRVSDISLGDLWGVHLYCPELYGKNGGVSLVLANTIKGKNVVKKAQKNMYGHELNIKDVLKYQSPLRKHIDYNIDREYFMENLKSNMSYEEINSKWVKKPSLKLLWQKYIWGNRQKVTLWNIAKKIIK